MGVQTKKRKNRKKKRKKKRKKRRKKKKTALSAGCSLVLYLAIPSYP